MRPWCRARSALERGFIAFFDGWTNLRGYGCFTPEPAGQDRAKDHFLCAGSDLQFGRVLILAELSLDRAGNGFLKAIDPDWEAWRFRRCPRLPCEGLPQAQLK